MITTALASAGTGPRRFYLGDTGQYVVNDWYYLGSDGAMVKGQQTIDGKWYISTLRFKDTLVADPTKGWKDELIQEF